MALVPRIKPTNVPFPIGSAEVRFSQQAQDYKGGKNVFDVHAHNRIKIVGLSYFLIESIENAFLIS